MKLIRCIFVLAMLSFAVSNCTPDPIYPKEPVLTFKEYIDHPGSDSLEVVYSFTDGDGDIGVALTDTMSNMQMTIYYRDPATSVYKPLPNLQTADTLDSIVYKYRIPKLTAGQSGLEGDIYITVNRALLSLQEDTVRFNTFLLDQSRNKSAYVLTPEKALNY
jgi:hypothetical protein